MKTEQLLNRVMHKLCCVPGWLWRTMFSIILGFTMLCTMVPWAQAQRAQPTAGGEWILTLVIVALPWVVFQDRG